ncbi:DUF3489 domain-containing protein [Brevundimonas sp.]|uniref:DUF3489 domain-containing protein n=1 Tax=Brevundimonas sp. TaxID=1871086 RepID=UPI00289B9C2D|nr:DUF3489 domain-containing protein [Brevundimonas sp.]
MPKSKPTAPKPAQPTPKITKLDQLIALLKAPDGATMDEMMAATGWQAHSVRGAMAGALRKKGLAATSAKTDGVRRWRLVEANGAQ